MVLMDFFHLCSKKSSFSKFGPAYVSSRYASANMAFDGIPSKRHTVHVGLWKNQLNFMQTFNLIYDHRVRSVRRRL